jgi:hypothetical protein
MSPTAGSFSSSRGSASLSALRRRPRSCATLSAGDAMTEPIDNITPLHPSTSPARGGGKRGGGKGLTNAERQRRFKQKRKQQRLAAVTQPVTQPVEPKQQGLVTAVTISTTVAALSLAAVSAGFSITGMTAVFVGATLPVIGMGVALELGKLSAVACLGRRYGSAALRAALVALVAVLMGLNAIGAYGFLAKAHIGHAVAGDVAVTGRSADIDARLSVQVGVVNDLDRRIGQIDGAIEKATSKGHTGSAMALADNQRKTRTELVAQRTGEAKTLAGLQVEKASIDGERRKVEADLGPVRYLAALLGAGDQDVLRWFILVVALLLDPAAVLLLLAAASARR